MGNGKKVDWCNLTLIFIYGCYSSIKIRFVDSTNLADSTIYHTFQIFFLFGKNLSTLCSVGLLHAEVCSRNVTKMQNSSRGANTFAHCCKYREFGTIMGACCVFMTAHGP